MFVMRASILVLIVGGVGCSSTPETAIEAADAGVSAPDAALSVDAGAPDAAPSLFMDAGVVDSGAAAPWTPIEAALTAAAPDLPTGFALRVYDDAHIVRFETAVHDYDVTERIPVASGSKLVTGLLLLQVVGAGDLSLESTTGDVLGWTGPKANITVRQLLSFTSGLPPNHACTQQVNLPLEACVDQIATVDLVTDPGQRYDYGSTHMHVAARMAEVATGQEYGPLFAARLAAPLGITDPDATFFTLPMQGIGRINPLTAGGLHATPDEYARYLSLALGRGVFEGTRLIPEALFDDLAQAPHPDATVGISPIVNLDIGLDFRYGLGAWLECDQPAEGCTVISSAGAFGFVPWIDYENGYHAMLIQYVTDPQVRQASLARAVRLQQALKPLIGPALVR